MKDLEYDHDLRCWVKDGKIERCGHKAEVDCGCTGRLYEGEQVEKIRGWYNNGII